MSFEHKNLLIIDDDKTYLSVLGRRFEGLSANVYLAENLSQARAIANTNTLDYGIVDLKIDDESGLDFIQPLRAQHPNIVMILLTGYSSISTAVEAIKLGADNYLCKPANFEEIQQALLNPQANADIEIAENPPSVERLSWEHIQSVLAQHSGNISATARSLGMHRRTLQRKLAKRPVQK